MLHSTAQHSTAQHSTAQHSTAQHSTAQHADFCVRILDPEDGYDLKLYEMTQCIDRNENRFNNEPYGMTREEFIQWCIKQDSWSKGEMLPDGYVKQWTFWLYVNNNPVGYGRLRERLTEQSKIFGGNIGYGISKKFRGMGYGTYLFSSLLNIARELGIETILSTVERSNYASRAVNEKLGGIIVKETPEFIFFSFDDVINKIPSGKE